ncbi:MAG: glycerophosphodiester phosphodiesterase family protein, partial [Myxococcota bacterium]|nr:glycerophosphodiester phosphodiesterase family protein [Myxococcota bacterium]
MNAATLAIALSLLSGAPNMEVQGHRGARSVLPENTIPGFLHALDAGAHVLEMDTVVTADDQVVVLHDPVLNPQLCAPVGGGDLKGEVVVRAITLEALRGYHCTRLLKRFPKQTAISPLPIPTLAEVLAAVAQHPRGEEV